MWTHVIACKEGGGTDIQAWAPGIQQTKDKEPGCLQIKLRGNPWWSSDGMQVGAARLMACAILSEMDAQGFELVGSVDMSVGGSDNNGDCASSRLPLISIRRSARPGTGIGGADE